VNLQHESTPVDDMCHTIGREYTLRSHRETAVGYFLFSSPPYDSPNDCPMALVWRASISASLQYLVAAETHFVCPAASNELRLLIDTPQSIQRCDTMEETMEDTLSTAGGWRRPGCDASTTRGSTTRSLVPRGRLLRVVGTWRAA
jgi:hypothetical protein